MIYLFSKIRNFLTPRYTLIKNNSTNNYALDTEFTALELERIRLKILGQELELSSTLKARELQLIGELIQKYNFIEFNLRRCIEIFTHKGIILKKDKKIHLSKLSDTAKEGISKTEHGEIWTAHFNEIELHRETRNQLAHWAARHITGEKALLILTMNPKETNEKTGLPSDYKYSTYGIMLVQDLEWLVRHISKYDKMLAIATSEWYTQYISKA